MQKIQNQEISFNTAHNLKKDLVISKNELYKNIDQACK